MSEQQERLTKILLQKSAVEALRTDKDFVDKTLAYIMALEQQLRAAAFALERAKGLVGPNVMIKLGHDLRTLNDLQEAPKWFDQKIAAARELIDAKPPAPTGDL